MNVYVAFAVAGIALGVFLLLCLLTPVLMYRHHQKARARASETAPDGFPRVPGESGEAA